MNCEQASERLAALVYGDLDAPLAAEVQEHLRQCPTCRAEYRAVEEVRRLLGGGSGPQVRIDLPRLYREAAVRQARSLRRWRRAVVFLGSAAALLTVCLAGLRLQVRLDRDRLVVCWGPGPAPAAATAALERAPAPAAPVVPLETRSLRTVEEQLQLLTRLIHAVVDDVQALEQRQDENAAQLRTRLQDVQEQSVRRYAVLERQVDALYLMSQKGE